MKSHPDSLLTKEQACQALDITPEAFDRFEEGGTLAPEEDGRYDATAIAAAAIRQARRRTEITDETLVGVGEALSDVQPALERLAQLADRAGLSGDEHRRVMVEVAVFFNTFADVMNRATAALKSGEEERGPL